MPTSRIYINGGGNQSGFAPEEKRRETGGNERAWGRRGGKMERSVGGERERSSIDRENAGKWPSEVRRIGQHRRNDFDETVNTKGSSQSPIIDRSGSFFFFYQIYSTRTFKPTIYDHFTDLTCIWFYIFALHRVYMLTRSHRPAWFRWVSHVEAQILVLKLVVFYIFILYILR